MADFTGSSATGSSAFTGDQYGPESLVLPDPIGYPPAGPFSLGMIKNSFPVVTFSPCVAQFGYQNNQSTTNLFSLQEVWDTAGGSTKSFKDLYKMTMKELGPVVLPESWTKGVRLACISDNFPSDQFTNDYGESFFERLTAVASEGFSDLAQVLGSRGSGTQALKDTMQAISSTGAYGMEFIGKGGINIADSLEKSISKMKQSKNENAQKIGGILGAANQAITSRMDYPSVWKTSSWSPQYSLTVKLYNPCPGDVSSTLQYIIAPLAAILCLSMPQATSLGMYSWPYLHKIDCPGIFNIAAGYISGITVIKGGDQLDIAWNKRLGMVDVRIDFGSLYNSLVVCAGEDANEALRAERPTVENYLKGLTEEQIPYDPHAQPFEDENQGGPNSVVNSESSVPTSMFAGSTAAGSASTTPTSRVSESDQDAAYTLSTFG